MKYLVDSRLIVDVLEGETEAARRALALFKAHAQDELLLAQVSYVALSSSFLGIRSMQDAFLGNLNVKVAGDAPMEVLDAAYTAWSRYRDDNPEDAEADSAFNTLYVGALGLLYDGVMTSRGSFFKKYFETLNVVEP